MRDDLISREDTKQAIRHKFKTLAERCEINEVLNSMPSVQPKEKTGHWIEQEDYGEIYYCCTICGEPYVTIEGTPKDNKMNYCPCCGAKMGGDVGD